MVTELKTGMSRMDVAMFQWFIWTERQKATAELQELKGSTLGANSLVISDDYFIACLPSGKLFRGLLMQSGVNELRGAIAKEMQKECSDAAQKGVKMEDGNLLFLMKLTEDHGFVLGEKLTGISDEHLREFEEKWIERERLGNGFCWSKLQEALSYKDNESFRDKFPDLAPFTEEWEVLQWQIVEPDYELATTEWFFTLHVHKAERFFRFPYCSVAMSACNRVIQYYNNQ